MADSLTVDEATAHFVDAQRNLVVRHLETLAILGELRIGGDGCYAAPPASDGVAP